MYVGLVDRFQNETGFLKSIYFNASMLVKLFQHQMENLILIDKTSLPALICIHCYEN